MYKITEELTFELPVGFYNESTGSFIREVTIDSWTGFDQEKLTSPTAKKNFVAGLNSVFRRLLQKIGPNGEMLSKRDRLTMCDERHVLEMFQADRDMLLLQSLAASGDFERTVSTVCDECAKPFDTMFDLRNISVIPHDHSKPPFIKFDLLKPIKLGERSATKATFHFVNGHVATRLALEAEKGEIAVLYKMLSECTQFENLGKLGVDALKLLNRRELDHMRRHVETSVGAENMVDAECPHCGAKNLLRLDLSRFLL